MKSWKSKVTAGTTILTACGVLNSCALFGGGKYASQTEVETDVPESLEQGKPSPGPTAGPAAYAENSGVPSSSNLIDAPDPYTGPAPGANRSGTPGGASVTSLPPDSSRNLIDIPKPDPAFGSVSLHNSRPPAEMLSLGPPLTPATPRMGLASGAGANAAGSKVVTTKIAPLAPAAKDSEITNAPKALPSIPSEPGVPLLHSGSRLNDFYKDLHGQLLDKKVVENKVPADNAAAASPSTDLSVPPPPPSE
jgi:hypothetical protein